MPTNHEVVAALPVSAPPNQTLLRNLIAQRLGYVFESADDVVDWTATDPTTGVTTLLIVVNGRNFLYDSTDTTSVHDGTTVCVSDDGKRYLLATGSDVVCYSVLDRTNTPPASPALGDAYLITSSPTGDWAGQADTIGVYTSHEWEFITPEVGRLIYVEDEDAFYRKKSDGTITNGFGANALAAGSVLPSAIAGGGSKLRWIVENQTTNTPPAVTNNVAYIIGPSPTGDWSGHAGKIAHGEGGAWVIYTPSEGWTAWDKANDGDYQYAGSAWQSAFGNFIITRRVYTSSTTWNKPARLFQVRVCVYGSGGGGGGSGNGATSSFGSHCSATGGAANAGAPGSGSGGDINLTGSRGFQITGLQSGGAGAGPLGGKTAQTPSGGTTTTGMDYGGGGVNATGGTNGGSGGGYSEKFVLASSLGSSETVTVGAAGSSTPNGGSGAVIVEEYTLA